MKYLVIDETRGDMFVEEFETEEKATEYAETYWNYKCEADKKKCSEYYVLESINPDPEAENHFDGDVVKRYK